MTNLGSELDKLAIGNDIDLIARDYVVLRSASKSDNVKLAIYSIDGIMNKIDNIMAKIELFKQNNIAGGDAGTVKSPEIALTETISDKAKKKQSNIKSLNNISDVNKFFKKIKS